MKPTKKQTLAAVDECLEIWGNREIGLTDSFSSGNCPLCKIVRCCAFCPCLQNLGQDCGAWAWHQHKASAPAIIIALGFIRAMVENNNV